MVIELLHIFAILCTAFVCGKLIAKIKLPAILGWLIAGIVFWSLPCRNCKFGNHKFVVV